MNVTYVYSAYLINRLKFSVKGNFDGMPDFYDEAAPSAGAPRITGPVKAAAKYTYTPKFRAGYL